MRDFLTTGLLWLAAWLGWRPEAALSPAPPGVPDHWQQNDQQAWRDFLKTKAGRKLMDKARFIEHCNAIKACRRNDTVQVMCARAGGFSECMEYLASLATPESITRTSREPDDDTGEATGELRLREKYAP